MQTCNVNMLRHGARNDLRLVFEAGWSMAQFGLFLPRFAILRKPLAPLDTSGSVLKDAWFVTASHPSLSAWSFMAVRLHRLPCFGRMKPGRPSVLNRRQFVSLLESSFEVTAVFCPNTKHDLFDT